MVFTGTYEHTIDSKNRLAIPAEVRSQIQREAAGDSGAAPGAGAGADQTVGLYVSLGEGGTLNLYTERGFEQRARELDDSQLDATQLLAYERLLFSLAQRVEIDKQGRVRLPESLLKRTSLGADVVLLGVKDRLEIRDRAAWQAYVEELLKVQPDLLMNPRQAMRQSSSGAF